MATATSKPRIRWWVPLVAITAAWLLALFACHGRPEPTIPRNVAVFQPLPVYQVWADQAADCVRSLPVDAQSEVPYKIVHDHVDVRVFKWLAVFTERDDGTFVCGDGKQSCFGEFVAPDSIFVSGQGLQAAWLIRHEVMHYLVESPGEAVYGNHGAPWGLCEFIG